ncbi:uncharacterized protein LOC143220302 [Lasioglossum baleicum]|uniref:uncharacterized protein LOC143220302 n=1 Tax=Lasioglossum baleicum TaxID=434251 RepID=UPI003FCCA7EE
MYLSAITESHFDKSCRSIVSKLCRRFGSEVVATRSRKIRFPMEHLKKWEEHIKSGGTAFDKYATIDSWTNDRFQEARNNCQQVTTRNLQEWALAAASQFSDLKFKRKRNDGGHFGRCRNFLHASRALIKDFHMDFVINTDQTGCQYQSTYGRTLAQRGSKVVSVQMQSVNKMTHSYTAQYAVTLSGKLLPTVFVCLQEKSGKFGPRVRKLVDEYSAKYQNVVVTSSKSGKLTTALFKEYLTNCLKPYVQEKKFALLIDSWTGQTDPVMYDELFQDDEGMPTCSVKVIPPKCTPLVQPCDVYFFRQVKNLIKRLQNCSYLIQHKREINSREDCIKIQSIVHHQLSSPIFANMIHYAWFASKLCDSRELHFSFFKSSGNATSFTLA